MTEQQPNTPQAPLAEQLPDERTLSELADISTDDLEIKILTDELKVNAFVRIAPKGTVVMSLPEDILRTLTETGIKISPEKLEQLMELLTTLCERPHGPLFLHLAAGKAPTRGKPGELAWLIEFEQTSKPINDEDQVDYRELRLIKNVRKGEKLATITKPTQGESGLDVFGNTIEGLWGEEAPAKAGENVRLSEDGITIYATTDGHLRYEKGIITVDPLYRVEGDVDFSVGNIDFNGAVFVTGAVQDGFRIRAQKGITICGLVGSATLESAQNIELRSGIAGRDKGKLKAAGSITAKYFNGAEVEAQGDILVSNEIINSNVSTMGKLVVQRGSIVGGEVIALGGIKTMSIGSPAGVKTTVIAGVSFALDRESKRIKEEISTLTQTIKRIDDKIGPLLKDKEKLKTLTPKRLELVKTLLIELKDVRARLAELKRKHNDLLTQTSEKAVERITVSRKIFPGAHIQIAQCRMIFTEECAGPVELRPNKADGSIKIRPGR